MKTIYIVRHGQSEGNLTEKFIGDMESPLSALGKEQAHIFSAELIHELGDNVPTAFITSRLSRAINTSKIAMEEVERRDGVEYFYAPNMDEGFKSHDLFYTEDDGLRPRSYGEIKGKDFHDPELGLTDEQIDELRFKFTSPFEGVEDADTMERRAEEFRDHLLNVMEDGETVIVACHKSSGKFLVHAFRGDENYLELFKNNCDYEKIEIDE